MIEENEELEIDLSKLGKALSAHKKIIILCVLIGIALGEAYIYICPKVYEVSAVITTPNDSENKPIVPTDAIASLVDRKVFIPQIITKLHLKKQMYSDLKENMEAQAEKEKYIYIYYRTADVKTGKAILSTLIELLQQQYAPDIDSMQQTINASISSTVAELTIAKNEIIKLDSDISNLKQKLKNVEVTFDSDIKILEDQKRFLNKQLARLTQRKNMLENYQQKLISYSTYLSTNKVPLNDHSTETTTQISESDSLLKAIFFLIASNKNEIYGNLLNAILAIDSTNKQIVDTQHKLNEINEKLKKLNAQKELNLSQLKNQLAKLIAKKEKDLPAKCKIKQAAIDRLKNNLNKISNIRTVIAPSYVNIPVKPNKELILAVSFIISLIVGSLWAIIKESKANRNE